MAGIGKLALTKTVTKVDHVSFLKAIRSVTQKERDIFSNKLLQKLKDLKSDRKNKDKKLEFLSYLTSNFSSLLPEEQQTKDC